MIPPACTESLWRALGKPEIVWWDATHFTAIQFLFEGLDRATRFFRDSPSPPDRAPAREATPTDARPALGIGGEAIDCP